MAIDDDSFPAVVPEIELSGGVYFRLSGTVQDSKGFLSWELKAKQVSPMLYAAAQDDRENYRRLATELFATPPLPLDGFCNDGVVRYRVGKLICEALERQSKAAGPRRKLKP